MRFLLLFATIALAAAQTTDQRRIGNPDVVRMLQAGVPEATIVTSVLTSARRGSTEFDISPNALIELRRAGASERVLDTVIAAQTQIVPGVGTPFVKGVFAESSGSWRPLNPFVLWTPIMPRLGVWPLNRRRQPELILDESAPMTLVGASPSLAVQGFTDRSGWQIVQMSGRMLRLRRKNSYTNDFLSNAIFENSDVRAVAVSGTPGDLTIRPATPLTAGSYLLCNQLQEHGWARICWGFQVTQ